VSQGKAFADDGAIRFKVPPGQTRFTDLVHGPIAFENEHIESFVILRSDGHPTYHLSVVVDDIDMAITHVVRGDDHISNTPKQVLLYDAFGSAPPEFAHVPLIMGPDKKRLSKRHGATSVMEYARLGYLPEAMVNFLALLGWSPGGDREVLTRDELIALFRLEGISGGNAVFNIEKLEWFNQQHIARMAGGDLRARITPLLQAAGLWRDTLATTESDWTLRVLDLLKPRARSLEHLVDEVRPFLVADDDLAIDDAAAGKHLTAQIQPTLLVLAEAVRRAQPFDAASAEQLVRSTAEQAGVKAAALIHATRVAVTGRAVSAGLFDVLSLLGSDRVTRRLERMANYTART
jgi:glutamyl-tRNA synthetase